MAVGDYSRTTYVNGGVPAISAANLNNTEAKLDELDGALNGETDLPNNLKFANGKGIAFTATADGAGMTSELLDDYEEGTFTPALAFGGSSVGITYSIQAGYYTKIGELVFITLRIDLTNKGAAAGAATIGGLPFTSTNYAAGSNNALSIGYFSAVTFADMMTARVSPNATSLSLYEVTNAGVATSISNADFANGSIIMIAGCYQAG